MGNGKILFQDFSIVTFQMLSNCFSEPLWITENANFVLMYQSYLIVHFSMVYNKLLTKTTENGDEQKFIACVLYFT